MMAGKKRGRDSNADLMVSVESRKGGVGKTTAALCLARILLRRGYKVLVLDMDVTGTNASDIARSPFWVGDIHVIQQVDEKSNVSRPLNLVTLFDQQFMAGKAVPEFSQINTKPQNIGVDFAKVNILGSQLYQTETGNSITCIERPAILFDDLHTLWLLELIKQITKNFVRAARTNKSTRTAIIFDNSPGYVGIAPAIHEWLTDYGPEFGKFLIVTSLDEQDLLACHRAINGLHALYTGKWKTSRLFITAGVEGTEFSVSRDQEPFFVRMATVGKSSSGIDDPLAFYRSEHKAASRQQKGNGQRYCDHPTEYIAAIINRVPRAVKTGRLVYDFPQVLSHGDGVIGQLFVGKDGEQEWRNGMISYDEYIENQFLLQSLQRGRGRYERRTHRLLDALKMAEEELRVGTREEGDGIKDLLEADRGHYKRLRELLVRSNDIVIRARSAVEDAGLNHLARLIHDEWLPGSIVPSFRSALSRLLRESDFPFFEMMPFEFDVGPVEPEMLEFVENIKKHILMELRHASMQEIEREDETADLLARVLSWLVGLSLTPNLWHSPLEMEIPGLLAVVLVFELKHWAKRREKQSGRSGIQHFLVRESVTQAEIRKDMERMEGHFRFFRHHMWKERSVFTEFYEACTNAQARLIDFIADSRFLLRLLRFIVEGEIEKGALFPFVRGIAEDVIINKTLSHEDAPQKMAKALRTTQYFREFDDVLNRVLTGWGMKNG